MKLTSREQEIAEVLFKEPLISQDELAERFGISRSSVAVHISNLMKKGIILGKGYVFNKKASLVVIGEVLLRIDVENPLTNQRIDIEYSGFSVEVSRSLASFGMNPKLLTVIGNDEPGNLILEELKEQDVDISNVVRDLNRRTSRKIYIDDVMQYAESIPDEIFVAAVMSREWVILNCDWLLVEAQYQELINEELFVKEERAINFCTCCFVDDNVPEFLSHYSLVVLGVEGFKQLEHITQSALKLVQAGTQTCIITDGSTMILHLNNQGSNDYTLPPNQSFDSNKDLHLFLAGLVYGLSCGYPIRQAIRIGIGNACRQEAGNGSP
ncbi:Carbohydrate kinase PfkB [Syntrophomonas zehnderi OL-4]|uniref:Carbohydrate kinase PfkB n=1 Tax=Syntrophomonas zehnderi OL-4 TaxID=690567 RepID=A0A0E4GCC6_9FIRM|nr:winged helix-turn-helix transcriptional regulator [Syntrophomonas zehnderi]CFX75941.1 Carbohydrate kinase PfkB [Syntrophomonas zehnderi OL-4]